MPYRRKFCGVYLYGKMCLENEAGKQTAFLPSMFPYAHVRYRLKGGEFAKRPRVRCRKSVNSCDWRKYLAGEGRVIAKMNATRIQMMLFWAKPISNRFFLFFSVSVLLNSFPWLTINVFFSMTHWSHLMLLNISRGRPVSWRKSLPIFSEVCGKLNSGIKFPLSISLQYFHGSQLMGSWFLLLMKGPHHRLV